MMSRFFAFERRNKNNFSHLILAALPKDEFKILQ